ncbi:MAG: phytoene/squalene synthase family protein [Gemmatimonadaceae bacterium]
MASSDARYCERVTRGHSRTFSLASRFLPAEKRRATYALYAFCRAPDDLVDVADASTDRREIQQRLDRYRRGLERALGGWGQDPVFRELAWAIQRFEIPGAPLRELLDGLTLDLLMERWETWGDLLRYCEGVAGCVGEMCAAVLGVAGGRAAQPVAVGHARALGVAMQLTNVLRDVGEDARRGRCYLPVAELAQYGLTPVDVMNGGAVRRSDNWRALMQVQVERARHYYQLAIPGIAMLELDAQRCARACALGYSRILHAIERNDYDSFSRRAVLGWSERALVLGRCLLPPSAGSRSAPLYPAMRP